MNMDPETKDQEGSGGGGHLLPRQFISLGTAPDDPLRSSVGSDALRGGGGGDSSASTTSNAEPPAPQQPMDYCPGNGNGHGLMVSGKDMMPLPAFEHGHQQHLAHERGSSSSDEPPPPPPHHLAAQQGWLSNKAPCKFLPAKGPEPVPEVATMRKARVSVRARSEAPMVCRLGCHCQCMLRFSELLLKCFFFLMV